MKRLTKGQQEELGGRFISSGQLADMLGLTRAGVCFLIQKKEIKAKKLGTMGYIIETQHARKVIAERS